MASVAKCKMLKVGQNELRPKLKLKLKLKTHSYRAP